MTRSDFAEAVFTHCAQLGGSITSWTRSGAHNAAVGGVSQSAHLYGLAADVVYDTPPSFAIALDTALRLGLLLLRESDHDHLQPIGWRKSP